MERSVRHFYDKKRPAIIALPGFRTDHKAAYLYYKEVLPNDWFLVVPNLPGHKPSAGDVDPVRNEEIVHDLVNELRPTYGDRILLVGYSGGGYAVGRASASVGDVLGAVLIHTPYDLNATIEGLTPAVKWLLKRPRALKVVVNALHHLTRCPLKVCDAETLALNIKSHGTLLPIDTDVPLLCFHGAQDRAVPALEHTRIWESIGAMVSVVPGGHGWYKHGMAVDMMRDQIAKWARRQEGESER